LFGAKTYGEYAYSMSWVSVTSVVCSFGLPILNTREISRYNQSNDRKKRDGLVVWSHGVAIFLSIVSTLVIYMNVSGGSIIIDEKYKKPILFASVIIWVLPILRSQKGMIRGEGKIATSQIPILVVLPFTFLVTIGVVYIADVGDSHNIILARGMSGIMSLFVSAYILKKVSRDSRIGGKRVYEHKSWAKSSILLVSLGVADVVNQEVSIIITGNIVGANEAGIYAIARRASNFVKFGMLAFNKPLGPIISESSEKGDNEYIQRRINDIVVKSLIIGSFIFLGILVFGEWGLGVFGQVFKTGWWPMVVLSFSQLINVYLGPTAQFLNYSGREKYTVYVKAVSVILNVVGCVIIVPYLGIVGASLARGLSVIAWNVVLSYIVYNTAGIKTYINIGHLRKLFAGQSTDT
jgi:O-antigen/teichoic acid export membrane protein